MKIDWDNAPEGTEAAHPGNEGFYPAWYRRDTAGLVEQICPEIGVKTWTWMGGRKEFPNGHVLRSASDKQAWAGEGLPPAGTVCEHKRVHEWQIVEVFAVKPNYNGSHTALFTYENGCWAGCAEPSLFRPIRTTEQISAEERQAAIKEMIGHIGGSRRCEAEVLYDAGYRKQVQP